MLIAEQECKYSETKETEFVTQGNSYDASETISRPLIPKRAYATPPELACHGY